MIQFWTLKEVIFVHYCVLQFAHCAVVFINDFYAMAVCCETVVSCVQSEVCNCSFSRFIFVDLMFCHCFLLDEAMASWKNFSCAFCFMSLLIVSKLGGVCLSWTLVLFFANRSAVSFPCITNVFSLNYVLYYCFLFSYGSSVS